MFARSVWRSEIEYFDDAVVSHDHVVGLDIAMNNSAGMAQPKRRIWMRCQLLRSIPFCYPRAVPKCDSFNVFRRDKSQAIGVAEFVDSENVG